MPAISLLQGALAEVAAVEPRPSTNALKVSLGAGGALEIRAGSAWQYGAGTIASLDAQTRLSEIFRAVGSQLPDGAAVQLRVGGAGGRVLSDARDGDVTLEQAGLYPGMHRLHLVHEGVALSGQAGGDDASPWISAPGKPSFLRVRWESASGLPSGHPQVLHGAAPALSPIVLIKNMDGRRGQSFLDETLKHVSAGQIRSWKGGGADFIRGANGFQQIFAEGASTHFGASSSHRISPAWTRIADTAMRKSMDAATGSEAEAKRSLAQQTDYYFCSGLLYKAGSKLDRHIDKKKQVVPVIHQKLYLALAILVSFRVCRRRNRWSPLT